MRRHGAIALAALATLATSAPAAVLHAQGPLHLLVVTGLSGEASFATQFAATAGTLIDVARTRWKVAPERVVWLAEAGDAAESGMVSGPSTRAEIGNAFANLRARSREGETVLVVLLGHGSGEREESRLSVPGPDPSAADYRAWLDALAGRTVVFVNASSASGDYVPVLSGAARIVITSTRSATERNASVFGRYFVGGIASGDADGDKDGTLTVLEAFDHARRSVAEHYAADGRLLTEHAQLDDNGDAVGSTDPTLPDATDGRLASRTVLGPRAAPVDPGVAALLATRGVLETEVEALRLRRDAMTEAAYAEELERLLVAIAEQTREIRAREQRAAGRQ